MNADDSEMFLSVEQSSHNVFWNDRISLHLYELYISIDFIHKILEFRFRSEINAFMEFFTIFSCFCDNGR